MGPNAAYDDIADWYETVFLPHQRRDAETQDFADPIGIDQALVELLGPGSGTCLELGCGTGIYADRVRSLGRTPLGIDLSPAMLGYAAHRLPVATADATALPAASASVDAAIGVMIHSDITAFGTVLAEAHRVLRPGGVFVHVGVHPCFIGDFADRADPAAVVIRPGYLDAGWTAPISPTAGEVGQNGQVRDKVGAAHHPLAALITEIVGAGFQITAAFEGFAPTPITLSLRAIKPGPPVRGR